MNNNTNPRIIICCNQIDCDYNNGRFITQDPSFTNQSMYNNVCLHPKPDVNDKNESKNNTMYDTDAIRTKCNSYLSVSTFKTVPLSEVSPILAPEHPEKTTAKKKRIHKHIYELDGGPCIKCGKTVAETIYEEIEKYNGKSK